MQNILKIFFVAITILFSSIIFALPSPKDIQSAMEDENFSKAESMLREVIAEKPQSAKAHYELGQVLARKEEFKEAYKELLKAKEIDPSLSFASNQKKFNDILEKVAQQRQTTGISDSPQVSLAQKSGACSGYHMFWYVLSLRSDRNMDAAFSEKIYSDLKRKFKGNSEFDDWETKSSAKLRTAFQTSNHNLVKSTAGLCHEIGLPIGQNTMR
jgi:tetratricopeptide (TPR) repeat protein